MKIIGSDYDGTFSIGGIDDKKLEAVRKWRDAGNKFGMVSGRAGDFRIQMRKAFPELELDFFAMCSGAYITDANGDLIYGKQCREVQIEPFANDLFSCGCKFLNIVIGDRCVCALADENSRPAHVLEENAYLLKDMPKLDAFYQISVFVGTDENASKLVEYIRKSYGEFLNPLQNGANIDIVPIGVNKAQGLYKVMSFFGGTYDGMIAVGDNYNDMDMMREFRSYAMANGVDAVKDIAIETVCNVTEVIEKELND